MGAVKRLVFFTKRIIIMAAVFSMLSCVNVFAAVEMLAFIKFRIVCVAVKR